MDGNKKDPLSALDFAGGTVELSVKLCKCKRQLRFAEFRKSAVNSKVIHIRESVLVRRWRRFLQENNIK